ncbi:3-oxoacyl-ACP synthase [Flavobacteriaceae bacterium R33]|uniref:3-oxoacyl-ACP synthase n=1 Tax=Poritiphilus flavus TaxID=2697053 RepID=A0A6L9ECF4_9FLAO|nr:3-oxoacyl-ACP synthase [Poritiphilus flavus]
MLENKIEAYDFCVDFVSQKRRVIRLRIAEVAEALTSETKSSAGDKHETGRAMLQLEREKLGYQLRELEKMESVLQGIDPESSSERIGLGTLVETKAACFFMSISAGLYKGKKSQVFCISPQAPVGRLLLGKQAGDTYELNGKQHKILRIV